MVEDERAVGPPLGWHRALAYAVTGRDLDGLGQQTTADVAVLTSWLDRLPGGLADIRTEAGRRRRAGEPWPHRVPVGLMSGLGFAQFAAALQSLTGRLEPAGVPAPVVDRPLTADERRLLADVPPHHGA